MLLLSTVIHAKNDIKVTHTGLLCSMPELREDPGSDCRPGSTIGAEISGVESFSTLTNDELTQIRKALVDYKVIYFKGAAHLFEPQTQLDFAKQFGPVFPWVSKVPDYVEQGVCQSKHSVRDKTQQGDRMAENSTKVMNTMVEANKPGNHKWKGKDMPGMVARLVREPGDPFAFGEGYHADVSFFQEPPFFTFLVARELPGGQDDTFYIDTVKAYDTLPLELKQEIAGLNAVHHDHAGKNATHPIVRTHPETGKSVLYVNSHFTHSIQGYDEAEGKVLLNQLFDHIESQPVFKFKWNCDVEKFGTTCPQCLHALMWDNRQLQHTATTPWARDPVLGKRRRELHRVTISGGEAPYFRNSELAPKKSWLQYRSMHYEKKKDAIDAEIAQLQLKKKRN